MSSKLYIYIYAKTKTKTKQNRITLIYVLLKWLCYGANKINKPCIHTRPGRTNKAHKVPPIA